MMFGERTSQQKQKKNNSARKMDGGGNQQSTGEEHYDGGAFGYVALAFLTCVLVPWTVTIVRSKLSKPPSNDLPQCNCDGCVRKRSLEQEKSKVPDRKQFAQYALFAFLWLLWLVSLYYVMFHHTDASQATAFDPFKVLELDASASKSQIKRSYRTLTAKWHPDKNRDDPDTAEKMFIEVAKAYKTLTDEVARENWMKYGNPDGPQGLNVAIALPAWLVEEGNSVLVLLAYLGLFMIAIPASVITLWFKWKQLAPNAVMHATMQLYGKYLALGMKPEHMLEVLAASEEFASIPFRKSDAAPLKALVESMSRKPPSERPAKEGCHNEDFRRYPYIIKHNVLLYAHFNRLHHELTPQLRADLDKMLQQAPRLTNGLLSMIQQASRGPAPLSLIFLVTRLSQQLAQGCFVNQELLQLPHVDQSLMRELMKKTSRGQIKAFYAMGEAERRKLLRGDEKKKGLTKQQIEDVEAVLAHMSFGIAVEAEVRVEDEVGFISPGAIVSVFVRCARTTPADAKQRTKVTIADADNIQALIATGAKLKGSAARVAEAAAKKALKEKKQKEAANESDTTASTSANDDDDDNIDEDDTWKVEKAEKAVVPKLVEAHAPLLPQRQYERHWVILADPVRSYMWGIKKTSINGVDEPRERLKLMFQAPPKPGKYCWSLLIVSDSYLGVDQKVDVNFVVHPEPEIPYVEEVWSDDEVSIESESDSDDDFEDK